MSLQCAAGVQVNGPNIPLGSTVICQCRFDAANGIVLGWGNTGAGAALLRQPDSSLLAFGSALNTPFTAFNTTHDGEWFWLVIQIALDGGLAFGLAKPRYSPGRSSGLNTLQLSALGTLAVGAAGNLQLCGFSGLFTTGGAVRGCGIWHSILTYDEINAAIQPGVMASAAWGTGGLPATPWAFYNLNNAADLADSSGNGRPALVPTAGVTTSSNFDRPVDPNTQVANFIETGDSLTVGRTQDLGGYPSVLATLRPADTAQMVAVSGQSVAEWLQHVHLNVVQDYIVDRWNVALLMIGTNSCLADVPAATAFAQLEDGINQLQSFGFDVMVTSILPFGYSFHQAIRTAFNGLILSSSKADYIADFGSDPYYVPSNPLIYDAADQVHLLQATGYTHFGTSNWNPAINDFLGQLKGPSSSGLFYGAGR